MDLRSQKQVMAELDRMNGARLGRMAKQYRKQTIAPLMGAVGKAKSLKGLLRNLNGSLVKRMDTGALETALAETDVQSALIGRVTAEGKEGAKGQMNRGVERG